MGFYNHEYEKPGNTAASGAGCVKCGHAPDAPVHQMPSLVPRAVQRSKRWMREREQEKKGNKQDG